MEDAVRAASLGAAAVWVSNHGGRQLDGVDAAVSILYFLLMLVISNILI